MEPTAEQIREILDEIQTMAHDRQAMSPEDLGILYQELLEDPQPAGVLGRARHRKTSGAFYTDQTLAQATVRHALQPLMRGRGKDPQAILDLRICDPAMGCGAFLLATLRILSQALAKSLVRNGWLADRRVERPRWWNELLGEGAPPSKPVQLASWPPLRALVARVCLYGVDLDPKAVELARAALCLEVGDERMGRGDLEENLRCGNALIGAWRRQLGTYPVDAWRRKGGDHTHRRGVHFARGAWGRAIDERRRELDSNGSEKVANDLSERSQMDLWCALWFWSAERIAVAPLAHELASPGAEAVEIARGLAVKRQFFHWHLEFPRVFAGVSPGFDAVVGNPPWEILKSDSKAFFGEHDPHYGTYSKQRALDVQRGLFAACADLEREWLDHCAYFQDLCNWIGRGREVDERSPFRCQGQGDPNTYKLFVELGHELLRDGGCLGMVVPSGLYTDLGCVELRELLMDRCRWKWLYSFENRRRIFPIDNRFKFAPIVVQKGGRTGTIRTAFLRQDPEEWQRPGSHCLLLRRQQVLRFSPRTRTILEITQGRDLEILKKIYAGSVFLGDPAWGIRQARELDMTNDSHLFPTRVEWEARGFVADGRGHWLRRSEAGVQRALPLIEGRMVGAYRCNQKAWVSGVGRRAIWRTLPLGSPVEPQYLVAEKDLERIPRVREVKLGFMAISSATNARSMIATAIPGLPCGNAVPVLRTAHGVRGMLALLGLLNSTVFDYVLRLRLGGINLNYFVLQECPLPEPEAVLGQSELLLECAALAWDHPLFADAWAELGVPIQGRCKERRHRRAVVDAAVARLYGLDRADLAWILRDCEHPVERLLDRDFLRQLDPKGFWRMDRDLAPERRLPALTLDRFCERG